MSGRRAAKESILLPRKAVLSLTGGSLFLLHKRCDVFLRAGTVSFSNLHPTPLAVPGWSKLCNVILVMYHLAVINEYHIGLCGLLHPCFHVVSKVFSP